MSDLSAALLDTSTLSEVMRHRRISVVRNASNYLNVYHRFTFSIITRYEILRGLEAKAATRQIANFNERCSASNVLPLNDEVIVVASQVYAQLRQAGQLISDADILIAATALCNGLDLVTENAEHFRRIPRLNVTSWREAEQ